jgi:hypothetical protein
MDHFFHGFKDELTKHAGTVDHVIGSAPKEAIPAVRAIRSMVPGAAIGASLGSLLNIFRGKKGDQRQPSMRDVAAGAIIGGAATGLLSSLIRMKVRRLFGQVPHYKSTYPGAAMGVVTGAGAGALTAKGPEDRLTDALKGGLIGAGSGGAFGYMRGRV